MLQEEEEEAATDKNQNQEKKIENFIWQKEGWIVIVVFDRSRVSACFD